MSDRINDHYIKVRKFRGIGADFRGVKIEIYKSEVDDKPIFSIYNEVSKSQIPDEKDVDYDNLVEFMKSRILSNIRKSKYVDFITPMFKNHIRKLAVKGQEIIWNI